MRGAPFGFALAALLFAQSARAEGPAIDAPPAPPPAPAAPKEAEAGAAEAGAAEATGGEEIIVFGQLQVAKARKKLDRDIRELGYRNGEKKGDHTVYRPQSAWRPTVVVYDDGFVVLRRTRPRFEPWVKGKTKLVWLSCIPPFTLMCIKLSGWLVSPARLQPQKARVANGIDPELRGWREAPRRASTVGSAMPCSRSGPSAAARLKAKPCATWSRSSWRWRCSARPSPRRAPSCGPRRRPRPAGTGWRAQASTRLDGARSAP